LALSDPDREVVLAAIRALEDIDHVSAVPHLQSLLQDPDPEVREAAEFAIEYIQW
jgi:HEAT repeat protein